ncbi:MAG: leucyl aminopeptidase family protein [Proteobacteria bacterium]|nr:leucyl aminopeptidase family protein [Pseudomonadota bacterium]
MLVNGLAQGATRTEDALLSCFTDDPEGAVPITPMTKAGYGSWLAAQPARVRAWLAASGFTVKEGASALIPGPGGRLERVLVATEEGDAHATFGALAAALPAGIYRLDGPADTEAAAVGWGLGAYRFTRYRAGEGTGPVLLWPSAEARAPAERAVAATWLVRDLINTPASDLGPRELAQAAREVAGAHGAAFRVIAGDKLLKANYPAVHAVGRGSPREPRVVDFAWRGSRAGERAPKVTLVGKGVCFDTGGLDLKPAAGMQLMKKDMGGAAQVLGLAKMVMEADLPLRLRVLVGAVENSVSGDAMRPLDVIRTRKGLTVEVGNTDAEGRLVLADLLCEGDSERPDLLVDCATLTGAARVALGAELPALFGNDDELAESLLAVAQRASDPLWRLPLWRPYRGQLESKVADLSSTSSKPHGGAISAALFLAEFVSASTPWLHLDIMAWNPTSRPAHPEGGEAMGMRALYALIAERIVPAKFRRGRRRRMKNSPR